MSKATSLPASLPFDPTMPHPIPLPFPGEWHGVTVIYDLYAVLGYLEAEPVYMADSRAAKAALDARAVEGRALPPGPDREAALAAYTADQAAWQRADALRQIAFFVIRVEWPFQAPAPVAADPATWDAWPTWLLLWLITQGWNRAHGVVYDPKLGI